MPIVGERTPPDTRPAAGACSHWVGAELRYCRATEGVRRYVQGYRCPPHVPGAPQSNEAAR